jgi:hypothetical protein
MTVQASLAEELACFQNPDDRFLALVRKNNDLDPPCLNVKYRICRLPLGEDDLNPFDTTLSLSPCRLLRESLLGQTNPYHLSYRPRAAPLCTVRRRRSNDTPND